MMIPPIGLGRWPCRGPTAASTSSLWMLPLCLHKPPERVLAPQTGKVFRSNHINGHDLTQHPWFQSYFNTQLPLLLAYFQNSPTWFSLSLSKAFVCLTFVIGHQFRNYSILDSYSWKLKSYLKIQDSNLHIFCSFRVGLRRSQKILLTRDRCAAPYYLQCYPCNGVLGSTENYLLVSLLYLF
jgi:hypothetical protein